MKPPELNPLTEEHCECLNAVLGIEQNIRDLIQRCKACKIELGDREDRWNQLIDTAKSLKAHFFPDKA